MDVDGFPAGTPSWVDVTSGDTEASAAFYEGLFGWETVQPASDEETGGYRMFLLRGRPVAGLMPAGEGGPPPMWSTYVCVDDAAATAERARAAGGSVPMGPIAVMEQGHMAVVADTEGAAFGLWQPGAHRGAGIVNEPGALCWNELDTRDPAAASAFYGAVFGWAADLDEEAGYWTWMRGGEPVAGMLEMDEGFPPDVPPNWLAYFAVADVDEAAGAAGRLGGAVLVPRMDSVAGPFTVLADPQGAVFGVVTLKA
jgi:predicted enzyme related to lactoylglutathione lyase